MSLQGFIARKIYYGLMTDSPDTTKSNFWADTKSDVSPHQFQALVNSIDDGIYQLDPGGNFVAVNDVIVEITSYSRDELLGKHVSLILDGTAVVNRQTERDFTVSPPA